MTSNIYTNIRRTLQSDSPLPFRPRYFFRKAFKAYADDNLSEAFQELLNCLESLSTSPALKSDIASLRLANPDQIQDRATQVTAEVCYPIENYVLYVLENLFGSFVAAQSHRQAFKQHCASLISESLNSAPGRINPLILASALGEIENRHLLSIAEKQYRERRNNEEGKQRLKELIAFLNLLIKRIEEPESFHGQAIVFGPAYDRLNPPEIDQNETLIRVNQIPDPALPYLEYKGRCHRLYLNAEFAENNRSKVIELAKQNNISVYLREKHAKNENKNAEASSLFHSYQRPKNLFVSGYANMIQGVSYSLLKEGFYQLRLSGVDFYSGSTLYRTQHYSADKKLNETLKTLRKHNLIENFAFIKHLQESGFIDAADLASSCITSTIDNYAHILDKNVGKPITT